MRGTQTAREKPTRREQQKKRGSQTKYGQMDTIIVITFCEISFTYCTCDDRKNLCDKHKKISASHEWLANRHKYNIKFVNLFRTRSKQSGRKNDPNSVFNRQNLQVVILIFSFRPHQLLFFFVCTLFPHFLLLLGDGGFFFRHTALI